MTDTVIGEQDHDISFGTSCNSFRNYQESQNYLASIQLRVRSSEENIEKNNREQ